MPLVGLALVGLYLVTRMQGCEVKAPGGFSATVPAPGSNPGGTFGPPDLRPPTVGEQVASLIIPAALIGGAYWYFTKGK